MKKYIIVALALCFLFTLDASASSDPAQIAGEATGIITEIMRAVFSVIVEFFGDILDEIVRAIKEIF